MLERTFQSKVIKELKKMFEDSIVLKLDAGYIQGIPDILILKGNRWAALEIKRDDKYKCQPNQKYYIERMNKMSFARIVTPENWKEVLNELQSAL